MSLGLKLKWTDYIPYQPYPKQLAFLLLPHREAFFGGAAGGGKSDALLMAALQYVDVPGYSALIIRKTFKDLSQPGALISRSHEWLFDTPAKWNNTDHTWTFQTHIPGMPATLSFGYLSSFQDKFKYQGSEFQFVGVDEATHVSEEDYCYVGFTRCRKPRCGQHPKLPDPKCETCRKRQLLSQVPLRTRAASNPPSIGQGEWVKLRFAVQEVDGIYRGTHAKRAYIPSFVQDNPALDPQEYADSLSNVDPVTRAQLLKGDWGAKTEGRFKPSWFRGRTWVRSGDMWNVGSKGLSTSAHVLEDSSYLTGRFIGPGAAGKRDAGRHFPESYHTSEILWFVMTDPAASYREGPGDKQIWRREPSWTVFGLFGLTPKGDLLVADVARFQREIPDVIRGLHGFIRRCVKNGTNPQFIGIEANGVGKGVYQQCQRDGLPVVDCTRHTHDKFIYATPAMNRAAYGQIYLPAQQTPWLDAFTSELYGYTGHPQVDTGDQVDVLAHAAQYAHSRSVLGEQVWPTDVADMVGNF